MNLRLQVDPTPDKASFGDVSDQRSAITHVKHGPETQRALIQTRRGEIDYGERNGHGFAKSNFLTRLPLTDEVSPHRLSSTLIDSHRLSSTLIDSHPPSSTLIHLHHPPSPSIHSPKLEIDGKGSEPISGGIEGSSREVSASRSRIWGRGPSGIF